MQATAGFPFSSISEALGPPRLTAIVSRMRTFRLVAVLVACLLSQGCVGVLVCSKASTTIKRPFINPTGPDVECVSEGFGGNEYTGSWLKSNWGTPKSVKAVSGSNEELWTYQFKRQCWCGVIPMVIIPIPLVVPTGTEKAVFLLRDGRVVSAKRAKWWRGGAMAGLVGPEGPFAGAGFSKSE